MGLSKLKEEEDRIIKELKDNISKINNSNE